MESWNHGWPFSVVRLLVWNLQTYDRFSGCNPNEYFDNWTVQFEAQNASAVTATYTPEVVITTNAYGILSGPSAVQGFYQNVFTQGFNKAKVRLKAQYFNGIFRANILKNSKINLLFFGQLKSLFNF